MALVGLGVSGGISAYKSVELVRLLQKQGHDVSVIMTRNATRFVGPLTFEALTGRPVAVDQFKVGVNTDIDHIALASTIDLLLVAPGTANVIGKFAHGIADDYLSSIYLATKAPVVVAPSMNTNMFSHPSVQRNLDILKQSGVIFVEPGEGYLACGWVGKGRLADSSAVMTAVNGQLNKNLDLAGRRVLVTAGPTYEDLDPVRYLGNRSSGRMGFAVAAEAKTRGADVHLVTGPTTLEVPPGIDAVRIRSAAEMEHAVFSIMQEQDLDVVVMTAAVADYTFVEGCAATKLHKDDSELVLRLRRTTDILSSLGSWRGDAKYPVLVGFSAETGPALDRAQDKLKRKGVDLIVANDISERGAGFDGDTNVATLVFEDGIDPLSIRTKRELARSILDRVCLKFVDGGRSVPRHV